MKKLLLAALLLTSANAFAAGESRLQTFCAPDEGGSQCYGVIKNSIVEVQPHIVEVDWLVYFDDGEHVADSYTPNEVRVNCATNQAMLLSVDSVPMTDGTKYESTNSVTEADMLRWICEHAAGE
jgi:hypothetical protein